MMENDLSDILAKVREGLELDNEHDVGTNDIRAPIECDVVAIDGGSSTIWSNGPMSIGALRYGFVSYSPTFKIGEMFIKSEFVLIREGESSLDLERHRREVSMIAEASKLAELVMFDGALSRIPDVGLERAVGAAGKRTTVVGVSKRSSLSILNGKVPDIWLPLCPSSYRAVPENKLLEMIEMRNLIEGASTVYARFHEKGPKLRVDIAGEVDRSLSILKHYSFYNLCPGYPFPLAEVHRLVCMDDKRGIYENVLRNEMDKSGMGDIFIKGRVRDDREMGDFHSKLDGLI